MRYLHCLIFLVLFFSLNVVAAPSLEDYARHAQFLNIKISPDGKLLAATMRNDEGRIELIVLDREKNMQPISRSAFTGDTSIGSFDWANNFRIVFSLTREIGALDKPVSTGELYAMNADGKRQASLFGPKGPDKDSASATVINWLPDDDKHIVIYARPWARGDAFSTVYRLNIDTGRKRQLTRTPLRNANIITDRAGNPRFAVGADPARANESIIMTRTNGDWQEISRFNEQKGGFTPLAFIEQDTKVLGLSSRNTDTTALSMLDLNTKQESIVYHHPNVDVSPIISIKDSVLNEVIGVSYEYDAFSAEFFNDVTDKAFRDDLAALVDAFPGKYVYINSATRDGSLMTVAVSSNSSLTEYYFYDRIKKQVSYLLHSRPWMADHTFANTNIIFYTARDGTKIQALLTLPQGKDAANLPLVLMPHGGPHYIRDSLGFNSEVKLLAQHGYAVLQPNFRGSGGFGKAFQSAGYRNWGRLMIDDMTDGVQHLIKTGVVNKERICTMGASYGGYSAIMSAIREPDLYKCAVGYVGVYDLETLYKKGDTTDSLSGLAYLDAVLGRDVADLRDQSPVHRVNELKAPVFIVHGAKDIRATIDHANMLKAALDAKGHPYQWLVKENEGHGFYKPENNVELWGKVLEFLNKNMPEK